MKTFDYWNEVPEECYLKSQLKEMGLRPKSEEDAIGQIYVKSYKQWCKLYKKEDCVPIKKMSEEHKAAIKKAHEKYYCDRCGRKRYNLTTVSEYFAGYLQKQKRATMRFIENRMEERWCEGCSDEICDEIQIVLSQNKVRNELRRMMKKEYLMLKIETTGLSANHEIIQIAIINQDEEVLMHTYVKPEVEVSAEAKEKHGKDNEDLKDAPTWIEIYPKVKEILENKTVFMFNDDFVMYLMYATCRRYDLEEIKCKAECVMSKYAYCFDYDSGFVPMSIAAGVFKTNEALHDCLLVHKIMHRIIDNKK